MSDILYLNEPIATERDLSVYLVDSTGAGKTGVAGTVTIKIAKPGSNLAVDAGVSLTEVTGGVAGGGYRLRLSADAVSVVGQGHYEITQTGTIQPCYGCYTVRTFDQGLFYGLAAAGGTAYVDLPATAVATDSYYASTTNPALAIIVSGAGAGQARVATAYSAARRLSVSPNWTTVPDATSVIRIEPASSSSGLVAATIAAAVGELVIDPGAPTGAQTLAEQIVLICDELLGDGDGFPFSMSIQRSTRALSTSGETRKVRTAWQISNGRRTVSTRDGTP